MSKQHEAEGAEKKPDHKKGWLKVDPEDSKLVNLIATHRGMSVERLFKELAEGRDVRRGLVFVGAGRVDVDGRAVTPNEITRQYLRPLLAAAGLPDMGAYALRHTCATLLLAGGVNPKIVSERLGHSSVTITLDTYSHVLPGMQSAAVDVLGMAFTSATSATGGIAGKT
ncbi:MAG: tyrosine-type recombinase/integrase [Gemmataceae bacterium]